MQNCGWMPGKFSTQFQKYVQFKFSLFAEAKVESALWQQTLAALDVTAGSKSHVLAHVKQKLFHKLYNVNCVYDARGAVCL